MRREPEEIPAKHRHLIINLARQQRGHGIPRPTPDASEDEGSNEMELGDQLGAFA